MTELKSKIIFVMGVSGSGKSSVGELLAQELDVVFLDGDDYHPRCNIEKMSQGIPLTDQDRKPWLERLNSIATQHLGKGCVIACSALKKSYRDSLSHSIEKNVRWIYLKGSYDQIFSRMQSRKGHFMDPKMLESQFSTLEEPKDAIEINIAMDLKSIIEKLKA